VIEWDKSIHLPTIKIKGRNTKVEYLYWDNATFERIGKWLIIYPKFRFSKAVEMDEDIDRTNREYKLLTLSFLETFQKRYPSIRLDVMNAVWKIKEFELKEPVLNSIPKRMRFKDTVGKKVYPKGVEFYKPMFVKNYLKNMSLMNNLPRIEDSLLKFTSQLDLHLQVLTEMKNALKLMRKPSLWQRIKSKIW